MSLDIIRNNGVTGAGTLRKGALLNKYLVGEQNRSSHHQKPARTGWSKEMNVAVLECYFFSRQFDEEEKPKEDIENECITTGRKDRVSK